METQAQTQKMDTIVQNADYGSTISTGLVDTRSRWRRAFLKAFAKDGNLTRACGIAGCNRVTVYKARKRSARFDEAYKRAAADARRRTADSFEKLLHHRARHGYKKAIVSNGQVIGHERKHDSRLLLRVLEAENPRKYGKRNDSSHTVNVLVSHDIRNRMLEDPEYARLACQMAALDGKAGGPEIEV